MPRFIDHRKNLEGGHEFFIRRESYKRTYKIVGVPDRKGLYLLKMDDVLIPGAYVFLQIQSVLIIYTGSGVAVTSDPIPFYEILFIN